MKILKKWNNLSAAKKASLALVFASFCQKGISMISTPVFTRIMDTGQYGMNTNFIAWQTIIFIIATMNLSQGVFNNGMLDFKDDRESFTASVLVLSNLGTILCAGLYWSFRPILGPIIGLSEPMMIIMFLYMFFYPAYSYWSCRQRYEFKYRMLTFLTIFSAAMQVILGIILVLNVEPKMQAGAKIFATETVLIVIGIVMYAVIFLKARFKIKLEYIKYAFVFNIFLIPHYLALNVLSNGDRVMITSMVGEAQTAIYGVSYTAASVILIFWQAIEASWTPWLFEHLQANDKSSIKNRANQIITLFGGIAVLCMFFAPEIMKILASEEYIEGIYIIPSVTTGVYFGAVYTLYMRIEYYSKKTKATMFGSVFVALANIVLNYFFIDLFGYMAAGYTTLVCYILLYLFHFWYSRKIGMKNIYDDKYVFKLSVGMIVISLFVLITYKIVLLRYILILSAVFLCLLYRKQVIIYVKKAIK